MKRRGVRQMLCGVVLALSVAAHAPATLADTLFGAMEKAYVTSPTLNAARAGQRATDELVPQALSGWRPTVGVGADLQGIYSAQRAPVPVPTGGFEDSLVTDQAMSGSLSIQLSQPVFSGFRTTEGTKAAEARVDAGRQSLLETEQQVLFDVVQFYMDVYAGRRIVELRKQDVAALQTQLRAANERFAVGEITRTDVAQSEARLAESKSALVDAQTNLARAVASYIEAVGNEPGKLSYPKVANLPKSMGAALDIAGEINPRLLARAFVEVAAQGDIGVARSGLLPSAGLVVGGEFVNPDLSDNNSQTTGLIGATVSIPLYEAGLVYSQVRQAKQRASQSRIEVIQIARDVRRAVVQSWNAYMGLGQIIKNTRTQVRAAQLALTGVQQEYAAGTRTTLDVLDAQRELVFSQVLQVTAEKNRVVAGYQLLASIGHLTASHVGLKVPLYDPEENYKRVRNKWIGTGVETVE